MTREQMIDEAVRAVKGKQCWKLIEGGFFHYIVVEDGWVPEQDQYHLRDRICDAFYRIALRERFDAAIFRTAQL